MALRDALARAVARRLRSQALAVQPPAERARGAHAARRDEPRLLRRALWPPGFARHGCDRAGLRWQYVHLVRRSCRFDAAASVVYSLPLWLYRTIMFAWALWIAIALARWLRFAWRAWSAGGIWRGELIAPAPDGRSRGGHRGRNEMIRSRAAAAGRAVAPALDSAIADRTAVVEPGDDRGPRPRTGPTPGPARACPWSSYRRARRDRYRPST